MKNQHLLQLTFFSFLLLKPISAAADGNCTPASCAATAPQIRFPFRIVGQQPSSCGFPGFDLSCNNQNQTIIRLPSSRSYTVTGINYVSQVIHIDPDFCSRNQITDFNLTGTPFDFGRVRRYSFYNCSLRSFGFVYPAVRFRCRRSVNYSVIAVPVGLVLPGSVRSRCEVLKTVTVPARWNYIGVRVELVLRWLNPYCRSCEIEGRGCGLKAEDGETVCLGSSRGIPPSTKFGLSLGIGLPTSICVIGLVCYAASRLRDYSETHHQSINVSSTTIIPQPPSASGLDGSTIESYLKIMVGESNRLSSDNSTCAICLSEYKPKESLRTIPECDHYFHAECIDEWLKVSATCPICRNAPGSSSLVTPCSSSATNFVDLS